ncbi:MAG: hypothetical protein QF440_06260, partial [Candidatus Thalassarchaeaceae archaeon]|nr:hypothetical protein [Candidatus Thalassarchaeaceae archaeon]
MDEDVNLPEENNSPTVFDLIKNLLSPSTLPHVILLGIAGIGLYLLSSSVSDWLFAIGISGYIALSIGYALTAWMQEMKIIYRFSHIQPIPKSTSFIEKILLYVIRIMMSWIAPLMLSTIPFIILASYLTSDTGSDQVIYWAMSLASLFIIWSWAQGKAMASSLRIVVEARAMRLAKTPRDSKRFTSTTVHMFTIGIFAAFTYWLTISGGKNTGDMSLIEKLGPLIFAVCAIIVQGFLFWRTTERRKIDSERKDTAVFGFTWGLLIQLFVTWHLLSAYRRFTSDNWGVMLIVEELILMVVTVIAAIWSLAKDTHERGFRLFTQNNAIFWGLSFGFA